MKNKTLNISDLQKDDRNANAGTDLGRDLIKLSFGLHGAGRSVLVDKNLKVIGGNHALDGAAAAGIDEVIVVQTNGRQLVAVQRTDIDIDSKEGREMALADNRTAQANINFDMDVISDLNNDFGLDLDQIGIDLADGGPFFPDEEEDYEDAGNSMETDHSSDHKEHTENLFPIAVTLNKAEKLSWDKFKKFHDVKTDTDAFKMIFKYAKENL